MIVIVEEDAVEHSQYTDDLNREGVCAEKIGAGEFEDWIRTLSDGDVTAIEAFLLTECESRDSYPRIIRNRTPAPVIALNSDRDPALEATLNLFAAGVDDVVHGPIDVREILARAAAIRRRNQGDRAGVAAGDITIFADGRDPVVAGGSFPLPRRERRILEYLVRNQGRRVTKAQVFNAIYGLFEAEVEESVVESHVSKLRKKLRMKLGYDAIDSKRFLGYVIHAA